MKNKLPKLKDDDAAAKFVQEANLATLDLSGMVRTRFEFSVKDARVNMRLPEKLLKAVKAAAKQRGLPYQRFIRETLEQAVDKRR